MTLSASSLQHCGLCERSSSGGVLNIRTRSFSHARCEQKHCCALTYLPALPANLLEWSEVKKKVLYMDVWYVYVDAWYACEIVALSSAFPMTTSINRADVMDVSTVANSQKRDAEHLEAYGNRRD
eukprot:1266986-Amphidinium_carterae.2